MNRRKCLIKRVEALEGRLRLDVQVDVLGPILVHSIATALTLEEVEEVIERAENGGSIKPSPKQVARIAAAMEKISMELTGQPYDRIASLPWATLKRAQRILNHGHWPLRLRRFGVVDHTNGSLEND